MNPIDGQLSTAKMHPPITGLTPRWSFLLLCRGLYSVGRYRPRGCAGGAGRRVTRLAASGELNFPFGDLFKDRLQSMLSFSGKTRVPKAYARACALLGYVHNQLRLQGLDSAAPNDGQWKGALSGPEKEAFELRRLRQDCSVFAAVRVLTDRFEQDRDPLGVVFRKCPLGAETDRGELDTGVSVDRTPASRGIDLVALCEPNNASRHFTLAVGQMLGLRPRKRGEASGLEHFHSGNLAGSTGEARTAVSGGMSLPPRYRHKRDLRVYLKKVQWRLWPK